MNKKILVCDDDAGILDVVSTILSLHDFDVLPELQSVNVMERVLKENPDIVLVDLWMPLINGGDIAQKLKNDPETKNIPVIVFTASQEGRNLLKTLPVDAFIAKPFDVKEMVNTIRSLL